MAVRNRQDSILKINMKHKLHKGFTKKISPLWSGQQKKHFRGKKSLTVPTQLSSNVDQNIYVMGVDTGATGAAFAAPIISAGAACRTIKIC